MAGPNIGDLLMRVVADLKGFSTSIEVAGAKAGDKAGATTGKHFGAKFTNALKGMKGGILGGLGLGAGLGAVSVLSTAVGNLTNLMGDAVQMALEEEASIAKLGAALRANVPDWDGNTAAIEETLSARMRLGFADDEQRDSLALLVAATKDETKALEVQRVAMDLARLKGISLKEASEALVKVEAGQYRMLKSLGIQLPKNATATEALAAVTKVAEGQAEAYAETSGGKLLAAQIEIGEAMEKFGLVVLPLVADGAVAAADGVMTVVKAFDDLNTALMDITGSGDPLGDFGRGLEFVAYAALHGGQVAGYFEGKMRDMQQAATDAANEITTDVETMRGNLADDLSSVEESIGGAMTAAEESAAAHREAARKTAIAYDKMVDSIVKDAQRLIDEAFDPIELKLQAQSDSYEVHSAIAALAEADKKDEIVAAKLDIVQALDEEAQTLAELGAQGDLTKDQVDKFAKDAKAAFKSFGEKVPADVQKAITKLRTLEKFDGKDIDVDVNVDYNVQGYIDFGKYKGKPVPKAEGGPVSAGSSYLVGEQGPELFVPSASGNIVPAAATAAMVSSSAGGGNTYQVALPATVQYDSPRDVVDAMRMLGDRGHM